MSRIIPHPFIFVALFLALVAGGCASSKLTRDIVVETETNPKVKFAGYETYTWLITAAVLNDPQGRWIAPDFDAVEEIKYLIDRELHQRGMAQNSENPDMIVTFAAGIDMENMDLDIDPASQLMVLENVPVGGLAVILLDAGHGQPIWAGRATAEIQENPGSEVLKMRLEYTVRQMFAQMPN